ncbi:MAG: NADH-quinone oxidoreductase subunit NuoE [Nitrospirota bacterium]|nr:NADH-quinone oxidoreductase subunit NuoE [Nitrospirota bacterium]MDH5767440.1 NADH-quinone oxidoreductase subunit NuoE [Nitrospirota bacterium]
MFSETAIRELEETKARYPDRKAALLPALYIAQKEFGWLGAEAYEEISATLGIPKAAVRGVGTFYSMLKHKPMGRNLIRICTNVSCMILGAEKVVDFLRRKFGLEDGSTTSDSRFSLVIMECIGACAIGPAMLVNDDLYGNLTEKTIEEILSQYS